MKKIVIDIETKPAIEEVLAQFRPVFEEPKTKTAKSASEKSAEWDEGCTLHAHTSEVAAIGIKDGDLITLIYDKDEKSMINEFWQMVRECEGNLVGHYIKGFDLPYLMRRSYVNGIKIPWDLTEGRYFSKSVIDTMELWGACEYKATISLNNLSKALGVGEKVESDKLFWQAYEEDKEKALEYLRNDLNLTWLCAMKMGAIK